MAYETSIALNYLDLMSKISTFAAANGWTVLRDTSSDLTDQQLALRAPNSQCHVGMVAQSGSILENYMMINYYNFQLQAFDVWDDSLHIHEQVGAIKQKGFLNHTSTLYQTTRLALANSKFRYHIFLSDRKIHIVAQIGGADVSAYMGLILPYGSPSEFSYPILVGGSLSEGTSGGRIDSFINQRNLSNNNDTGCNWMFGCGGSVGGPKIRLPSGSWSTIFHKKTLPTNSGVQNFNPVYSRIWPSNGGFQDLGKNIDGSYPLIKCMIASPYTDKEHSGSFLGEAEGVFFTSGIENFSGNEITDEEGNVYVVFKNIKQMNNNSFFVVRK